VELSDRHPIFVGFKLDGSLRRQLDGLSGSESRYVSSEDNTFLRICTRGEHRYVGKLVEERLTTERIEDVRRNVLSIMQRLCPETRLPQTLEIWPCLPDGERTSRTAEGDERDVAEPNAEKNPSKEGFF